MKPNGVGRGNRNGGPPQWTNGHGHIHTNERPARPEERLSTLSMYWTEERNNEANKLTTQYTKLRRHCLERGIIWEDPDFLPSYKLLPKSKKSSYPIVWLRPH
ncbi:unnamed protein product, partial [Allacma fusca]